jgi:hypothetical protein
MPWDKAGNYWTVRRDGDSVVRECWGNAGLAAAAAATDEFLATQKQRRQAEADEWRGLDRAMTVLCLAAERLAAEALAAAGYRRHKKGEWRKRRGEKREGQSAT